MRKLFAAFFISFLSLMFTSGWNSPPPGQVLLTFDDGPHPLYTAPVLEILAKNDIKALFFVVGVEVERYPGLLAEISRQGHLIGVHTYTHRDITRLTEAELRQEIMLTSRLITEITGQEPLYFRPPRGKHSPEALETVRRMGLVTVMWDDGLERRGVKDPSRLVRAMVGRIQHQPNPIILLHDGDPSRQYDRTPTVRALPLLVEQLRARGYGFADPREHCRLETTGY